MSYHALFHSDVSKECLFCGSACIIEPPIFYPDFNLHFSPHFIHLIFAFQSGINVNVHCILLIRFVSML